MFVFIKEWISVAEHKKWEHQLKVDNPKNVISGGKNESIKNKCEKKKLSRMLTCTRNMRIA